MILCLLIFKLYINLNIYIYNIHIFYIFKLYIRLNQDLWGEDKPSSKQYCANNMFSLLNLGCTMVVAMNPKGDLVPRFKEAAPLFLLHSRRQY